MFTAQERLPIEEMQKRQALCLKICAQKFPNVQGLLLFSRINIYYLTGTLANGVLWLPQEGHPVLMVRKGAERCLLESPLDNIVSFSSYGQMLGLCLDFNSPISQNAPVGAEMSGLSWALSQNLQSRLPNLTFVSADAVLAAARSVKTAWELEKMRIAGALHDTGLCHVLPSKLRPGMSERQIAHLLWQVFFDLGHGGPTRMGNFGEECFLGHIAAGNNGNFPSHFNGPLGLKGEHPASPFMGNAACIWEKTSPLALDCGFMYEGYNTDKTQLYWSGPPSSVPDCIKQAQDACLDIQQRAIENLKTGSMPSEIWTDALQRAKAWGVEEGFMGLGSNKVRFLGHGIGLVVDESPVLANKFDAPLEAGMVLAIEPKVGIKNIGMVGTENTFEVTDSGGKAITGTQFDFIYTE